jgi:hypothetical protein
MYSINEEAFTKILIERNTLFYKCIQLQKELQKGFEEKIQKKIKEELNKK